ncbi:putative polysaccharide biosynthesis protein [Atopococcus tabaci]|uniref:putative polysaccharide biosynthesis protein n=1 Tax=Atopococcus tabaci TaxID=269774 RepID=UPI00240A3E05|nr:polysaccharide biosynthesis protein [Atopococcus tabaci]
MQNERMKKMVNGAIVLSAASFVTKLLSALYKVPFQNLTGDEGFYVYQQVYPLYGIAAALALNGLPVFVSKLTAELPSYEEQKAALKTVLQLLSVVAVGAWAACWFGAPAIAGWMGDNALAPLIRSVSFTFLVVPFLAVMRGYFQGRLDMMPTGISQVGEQVVRVGIILFAAFWFAQGGASVYQMGTLAMSASWIAGVTGVLVLSVYARKDAAAKKQLLPAASIEKASYRTLAFRLVTEGLAISAFSSLLILLQLIDSFTVYNGLLDRGLSAASAMVEKGVYDRGQPLVQLGMVIGTGFASSLLPLLSQQRTEKRTVGFHRTASSVLRITTVFASAATVGLIVLMPQFNQTLFSDAAGTAVLRVYVAGIFVASLIGAYNAILQSVNRQKTALAGLAAGLIVKVVLNRAAVAYFGTIGASLTTVAALLVVLVVLWVRVPGRLKQVLFDGPFAVKLMLSLLGMGTAVSTVVWLAGRVFPFEGRGAALLLALAGVAVGACVFLFFLLGTRVLTIREWLSLPFGRKIVKRSLK